MEFAFEGNPTKAEIRAALDESFAQFGMESTEQNYERAGDTLVALSNRSMEQGCATCTEMAILEYMNRSFVPGMSGEWHEFAALASTFLWAEETSG